MLSRVHHTSVEVLYRGVFPSLQVKRAPKVLRFGICIILSVIYPQAEEVASVSSFFVHCVDVD